MSLSETKKRAEDFSSAAKSLPHRIDSTVGTPSINLLSLMLNEGLHVVASAIEGHTQALSEVAKNIGRLADLVETVRDRVKRYESKRE